MHRRFAWLVIGTCACGTSAATTNLDAGGVDGGAASVGAACVPSPELSVTFPGFTEQAVTLDKGNAACGGLVCIVNHFRGRATCPYGQSSEGDAPPNANPCTLPGDPMSKIAGAGGKYGASVNPQCTDRPASKSVYCSCRCANAKGETNDGASYCPCPTGFACTQLVPTLIPGDPNAGGYCTLDGTTYDLATACSTSCDPASNPCTTPNASALGVAADGGATTYSLSLIKLVAGLCGPQLPVSAGLAQCQIFEILPQGSPCSGAPGLTDADPQVATTVRSYGAATSSQSVCLLAQLAQPCTSSPQPGWCYATGANAPIGCQASVELTSSGTPIVGVTSVLGCP